MGVVDLARSLHERAPWRAVVSPALKAAGFHVFRSAEDTLAAIAEGTADADQEGLLRDLLSEHTLFGEKKVRIARVGDEGRQCLRDWARRKQRSQDELARAHPLALPSDRLSQLEVEGLAYVGPVVLEAGVAAVFSGRRSYLVRESISREILAADARDRFDQVIGVSRRHIHTYDLVWIPHQGEFVYLLTDAPKDAPVDFAALSQVALEAAVRRPLGATPEFVNLWPAVDSLYCSAEGTLTELAFVTDSESVKHHKARRGGRCLRSDRYHTAGATVVQEDLVPYRVAVQWSRRGRYEIATTPELALLGSNRDAYLADPILEGAILRNCLTRCDFDFVMSKIMPHLS